jgi:hypothetical protein
MWSDPGRKPGPLVVELSARMVAARPVPERQDGWLLSKLGSDDQRDVNGMTTL